MKLKYTGNEIYLKFRGNFKKLKKNSIIEVTQRELERFKDLKDFKQVK